MTQKEPFLAGFSKHLYGKAKRSAQAAMQQFRASALRNSISGYGLLFDDVLPAEFLAEIDPTRRNRHFGHRPVFWAWIGQILEQNGSCSRALSLIQAWCVKAGLAAPGSGTSSYCKARKRLKGKFLKKVLARIDEVLRRGIRSCDRWHGFILKAFDGTSVKLLDTAANQARYPQPSSQKPGCGFPVMGVVGVLNISHGGWEGFTAGHYNLHDARAAQNLLGHVEQGDLILADRA